MEKLGMSSGSNSPWSALSAELDETQRLAEILANKVHNRVDFLLGQAPSAVDTTKVSQRPPAQGLLDDLHLRLQNMRNDMHAAVEALDRLS